MERMNSEEFVMKVYVSERVSVLGGEKGQL